MDGRVISECETPAEHRAEFLPSFVSLRETIYDACEESSRWEEKVSAAIAAALDFAAHDPDAAAALTLGARREASDRGDREREVLAYFTNLLNEVTPAESQFPVSTDFGLVESIALTVRAHLLADTASELPKKSAELVYLALMPYTGLAGARHWAEERA